MQNEYLIKKNKIFLFQIYMLFNVLNVGGYLMKSISLKNILLAVTFTKRILNVMSAINYTGKIMHINNEKLFAILK